MRQLHPILVRAPRLLYTAAVLYFVFSAALSYYQVTAIEAPYASPDDPVRRYALLKALFGSVLEPIYLAINGALLQVGLAIWAKLPAAGQSSEAAE